MGCDGVRVADARDQWVREDEKQQGFTMAIGLRTAGACARAEEIRAEGNAVKRGGQPSIWAAMMAMAF